MGIRQSDGRSGLIEEYTTVFPSGEHAGFESAKPLVSLTAPPAFDVTRQMLFPGTEVMIHAEPEDDTLEQLGYQPSEMQPGGR